LALGSFIFFSEINDTPYISELDKKCLVGVNLEIIDFCENGGNLGLIIVNHGDEIIQHLNFVVSEYGGEYSIDETGLEGRKIYYLDVQKLSEVYQIAVKPTILFNGELSKCPEKVKNIVSLSSNCGVDSNSNVNSNINSNVSSNINSSEEISCNNNMVCEVGETCSGCIRDCEGDQSSCGEGNVCGMDLDDTGVCVERCAMDYQNYIGACFEYDIEGPIPVAYGDYSHFFSADEDCSEEDACYMLTGECGDGICDSSAPSHESCYNCIEDCLLDLNICGNGNVCLGFGCYAQETCSSDDSSMCLSSSHICPPGYAAFEGTGCSNQEDTCCSPGCTDLDGDGYGRPRSDRCLYPELDCMDGNANENPSATEICGDGIDQDCNGEDLECASECTDLDGDGYGNPASDNCLYFEFDCDDDNEAIPSNYDACGDGIDQDCNGEDLECAPECTDLDGDGYGSPASNRCPWPELDCMDENEFVNPQITEICGDSIDQNCDGVDLSCNAECIDGDGDGYGSPISYQCLYPELDCIDGNSNIHPGATEICGDNIDQDCNGEDLECEWCIIENYNDWLVTASS